MRDRWVGRNVDLDLLSKFVKEFLESRALQTVMKKSSKEYKITAFLGSVQGKVDVIIRGEPNDFTVDFIASSRSKLFLTVGQLFYLFGGGILQLLGSEALELLDRLEKEFWAFMDEKIDFLSGSSGLTSSS